MVRRYYFQQLRDTWFWTIAMLESCCLMHTTKSKYLGKQPATMRQRRIRLGRGGKTRTASQRPGETARAPQGARHSWPRLASLAGGPEGRGPQGNCWGQLQAAEEPTCWVWGHWGLGGDSSQAVALSLLQKLSPASQSKVPYALSRKSSHLSISL